MFTKLEEERQPHELGVQNAELERIRQEVKRKVLGLLGFIGLTAADFAAWWVRQEQKRS